MVETLIGAPKKEGELTDADLNGWIAQQIVALQAQLPAQAQKMTRSGKYTWKEINDFKASGMREVSILENILRKIVTPPPAQSACQWKPMIGGGFEVHCYVSKDDLANITLPIMDADLFQNLMEQNHSVSILSAMALLFGHWEKQRQVLEKELIKSIEGKQP